MARFTICNACEHSDHQHHREVVQAVPKGMLGGTVCRCQGECKDGRYRNKDIQKLVEFLHKAYRLTAGQG